MAQQSAIAELWDALRKCGLEHVAPTLVSNHTTSINALVTNFDKLLQSGIRRWQLEAILAVSSQQAETPEPPSTRHDTPINQTGKRASIQAALEAALPNQRQKSLKALDDDVLARSTNPAADARVRTYLAICRAWEIPAFPLDSQNIRCFGASLKAGGYRSAAVYYQAICGHQQRVLRSSLSPMLRACIRDCVRSIQRGLGVAKLKDSFNGLLLGQMSVTDDLSSFSFEVLPHCRDMAIIGLWYMLHELEMAGAMATDLQLEGTEVHLTIPLHKTDVRGKYTRRTLSCSCGSKQHAMCIWHSAERHLLRLEAHPHRAGSLEFPLFPDADGRTATKQMFIEAMRWVIAQAGTATTRVGPGGVQQQRFHGHCLRVSGAQMLAAAGVELSLIQLLGRWTSASVQRYTQDSALVRVPQISQQVANPEPVVLARVQAANPPDPLPTSPPRASGSEKLRAAQPKSAAAAMRSLRVDIQQLQEAVSRPATMYVFRPRARILHLQCKYEHENAPKDWRTPCGWYYGCSNFLRTSSEEDGARQCKKCFSLDESSGSSSDSDSSALSDLVESSDDSEEDA